MNDVNILRKPLRRLMLNQVLIDEAITDGLKDSLLCIDLYKNYIVRVTTANAKIVDGVINPDEPVSSFGNVLRLNLLYFNSKTKLIEKSKRVIPVSTIKEIEVLGIFKIDTIQLVR